MSSRHPTGPQRITRCWSSTRPTNTVIDSVAVGTRPFALAVRPPDGAEVWVPNHDSGTVSIIDRDVLDGGPGRHTARRSPSRPTRTGSSSPRTAPAPGRLTTNRTWSPCSTPPPARKSSGSTPPRPGRIWGRAAQHRRAPHRRPGRRGQLRRQLGVVLRHPGQLADRGRAGARTRRASVTGHQSHKTWPGHPTAATST